MMKIALSIATATFVLWLWISFFGPAIARAFGVPVISGIWRLVRRNQHLERAAYVWGVGVFVIGLGIFLFLTLRQYAYCTWIVGKPPRFSGIVVAVRLIGSLAIGWVYGILTAPREMSDSLVFWWL